MPVRSAATPIEKPMKVCDSRRSAMSTSLCVIAEPCGAGVALGSALICLERVLLLGRQRLRNCNAHARQQVAASAAFRLWRTLPADAQHLSVLRTGRNLDPHRCA